MPRRDHDALALKLEQLAHPQFSRWEGLLVNPRSTERQEKLTRQQLIGPNEEPRAMWHRTIEWRDH